MLPMTKAQSPKAISRAVEQGGSAKKLYPEFWRVYCKQHSLSRRQNYPQRWMKCKLGGGRKELKLGRGIKVMRVGLLSVKDRNIGVRFQIEGKNKKALYDPLFRQKKDIEAELGFRLVWNRKDGKKYAQADFLRRRPANLRDRSQWEGYCKWMKTHLDKLDDVFRLHVKKVLHIEDGTE